MDNPEKTEEAITNGQSRRGNHEWTIKTGQSRMDNQTITNGQSRDTCNKDNKTKYNTT